MAWNINGGVNNKIEDAHLQDIFLEYDAVTLLGVKMGERQTFLLPQRLQKTFTAHSFPRRNNKPGGGIICLTKKRKWKAKMGTPKSRIKGTIELAMNITLADVKNGQNQVQKQAKARCKTKPLKI